jgi:peroxiredoxin
VQVLMVSRGEIGENRQKAKQHKLTFPIVMQRKWEISKLYAMFASPISYLIDEEGRTMGEVAVGAEAILALLSGAATGPASV